MKLEIKGVGATIPDHRHPRPPGRCAYMGPEVARDEIIQAEPSREALHAWVKVGGHRMCQLLLREYSSPGEQVGGLGTAQEGRSIPARFCLEQPRRALGERGQGEVRAVAALVTGQDAGSGWTPNEEEGGRGGALGGRTLRVMRREEFGARI